MLFNFVESDYIELDDQLELFLFYVCFDVDWEIFYKKNIPNIVDENDMVVKAIKYIYQENNPKKNVVTIPAINCDEENINVNIPLYLPLFYFPLHISLRYPP